MRIVACGFAGLTGPVTDGFFRFADVTAIVGPNDAGKSRLLDAFAAELALAPGAIGPLQRRGGVVVGEVVRLRGWPLGRREALQATGGGFATNTSDGRTRGPMAETVCMTAPSAVFRCAVAMPRG
jgi:hypothetical protein